MSLVVGFIEESPHHRFHNAALWAEGGRVVHVHRKVYLPTYGLFDEQRYFAAGERLMAFDTARFGRVGILICEDFWHLSAAAIMQAEEVDLLLCIANSPARGVDGPEGPRRRDLRATCHGVCATARRGGHRGEPRGLRGRALFLGRKHGGRARRPHDRPGGDARSGAGRWPSSIRPSFAGSGSINPLARDERLLLTIEEFNRIKRRRYEQ